MPELDINTLSEILSNTLLPKVFGSIFLILLLAIVKNLINRIIKKQVKSNRAIYKWQRVNANIIYGLAIVFLAIVWLTGIKSFTTFLGLLTAGLAFALKDIVADSAGYLFILIKQPFTVGDRIEINNIKGDVLQFDWFQITLLEVGNWVDAEQSTGRIVFVPMSKVLSEDIYNYSTGFDWIWNELKILVTLESDWKKAKSIITKAIKKEVETHNGDLEKGLKKAMQRHLIEYKNTDPIIYTKVVDSGVELHVRYLVKPKQRRLSEHNFWEKILDKFEKEEDIELAYPTFRYTK
ncbi:MAG: mechanosensitive ion channel protein MscS [Rickettsiales bacterium]|nr:mechanosensitive ion channel protein MscS [Rickettsiales bacterium]|tara:strand:+ start:382 stop:1260 length:879 start_codon:yes stop_codon:yes gene_type:complete